MTNPSRQIPQQSEKETNIVRSRIKNQGQHKKQNKHHKYKSQIGVAYEFVANLTVRAALLPVAKVLRQMQWPLPATGRAMCRTMFEPVVVAH